MQSPVAKKAGRPCLYTEAIADEILERIGKGEPLAVICRDEHLPARATVFNWIMARPEFAEHYTKARELGFDAIAAECLEIADDKTDDPSSRRVRTDVRLKLLAKWDPKRYGDKLDVNAAGVGEIRIVVGGNTD
jgi:hypothetical protein